MSISTMIMILLIVILMVIPSLKDRIIPVRKLAIIPVVFIYLFYQSATEHFYLDFYTESFAVLGIMIGIISGILIRKNVVIKADKIRKLIWVPGTYTNLVLFLLIFSVHFVIGYLQSANHIILSSDNGIEKLLLFVLAAVSSVSMGSSICFCYKYWRAPSIAN